jgi:hypothetical protein
MPSNDPKKDEIAKRIADKYLHRFVAAFNVGGHHEREHQRLTAMILEALTDYEALRETSEEGWRQLLDGRIRVTVDDKPITLPLRMWHAIASQCIEEGERILDAVPDEVMDAVKSARKDRRDNAR